MPQPLPVSARHQHLLIGLRLDAYAGYLGGLGLLRLANEQGDAAAQGFWRRGHFVLESRLDEKALRDFLLRDYAPTPIASPWNALGGFLRSTPTHPRFALAASQEARFAPYRATLSSIESYLADHGEWPDTPEGKASFVRAIHETIPLAARRWVETVATVEEERFRYSVLAFAGGCDGPVDFSTTFMRALKQLFLSSPQRAGETTRSRALSLLRAHLFGEATDHLQRETYGAIDPGTANAPAGSSDGVAEPLSNPWSIVLAMEGLLTPKVLRVRRQMDGGDCSVIPAEGKYEVHAPLWRSPMSSQQLSEAGAVENSDPSEYQRFGFLQRNGRAHFVLPLGRGSLEPEPLERAGVWLRHHRPEWCYQHGDIAKQTTRQLEELGKLRLWQSDIPPLTSKWLATADDGSAEFGLALALARLGNNLEEELHLRPSMGHLQGRDLCEKLIWLVRYRVLRGQAVRKQRNRAGITLFNDPFWSSHPAQPGHLLAFLRAEIDEARLENLLHGLCLVKPRHAQGATPEGVAFLPLPYRLYKLAFGQDEGDRRPAPVDVLEKLCANDLRGANDRCRHFLSRRYRWLGALSVSLSSTSHFSGRRLAAALLFPLPASHLARTLRPAP